MKRKQLLLLLALLITAATGAWAQTGMTKGLFSVSATKRVHFSKGNLQYDGTNWKFAASQWEVLGANGTGANGTATNYPMDLFTWGNIDSPTYNGTTYYTENADLSGITDWGSRMGFGWRTLSSAEWTYLFNTRTVNGGTGSGKSYTLGQKVNNKPGVVIYPDNYTGEVYSGSDWATFESAGCVFLPIAGLRNVGGAGKITSVGVRGCYWSRTNNNDNHAYYVNFNTGEVSPQIASNRVYGLSVRLVIDEYVLTLADGTQDAANWTITSGENSATGDAADGLTGLKEGDAVTLTYGGRLKVKAVTATTDAAPAANIVDLSTLTADYVAQDGDVLTGPTTHKVEIAAGATVTLDGVNISSSDYCIRCLGNATIVLKDGTTNTLTGTGDECPALSIGDANTTLTIQGSTGVLNVTSGEYCAGIGGGYMNTNCTCGNITIEGGVITAQGGSYGSGIGTDCGTATCGDIIITGGTITAKGGINAAGIGTGYGFANPVVCGDITIANTVTKVTATKGEGAPHSIGKGYGDIATCGTVTIGGKKYWENNAAVDDAANTYLKQPTIEYQP